MMDSAYETMKVDWFMEEKPKEGILVSGSENKDSWCYTAFHFPVITFKNVKNDPRKERDELLLLFPGRSLSRA